MAKGYKEYSDVEYVLPGSAACAGCPSTMAMRTVGKALGENAIMVMTPSCAVASIGLMPFSCYTIPTLNICFASAGASAGAISLALDALYEKGDMTGEKPTVFNWVGDGGTYDIGLQGISASAERNDDILHFCYNNEAYSNTGVQRSSATPIHAFTTTTPGGKNVPQKNVATLMLDHNVPYVATASMAYPKDLYQKVEKAKNIKGFKYIEIHAPCFSAWKFNMHDTVTLSRLAVKTGACLLWEAEYSEVKFNTPTSLYAEGKAELEPLEEYLKMQGRFDALLKSENKDEMIADMRDAIDRELKRLSLRIK